MPSPIAHLAAGYAIYALGRSRLPQEAVKRVAPLGTSLLIALGYSMLPDIDSALGLAAGDFGRFHNNATHSVFAGLVAASGLGLWLRWRGSPHAKPWFFLALICYLLHILMDAATVGRGVMALWPLTSNRYRLPIPLFYGFRWSQGLISAKHLVTIATELLFAGGVALLIYLVDWMRNRLDDLASSQDDPSLSSTATRDGCE